MAWASEDGPLQLRFVSNLLLFIPALSGPLSESNLFGGMRLAFRNPARTAEARRAMQTARVARSLDIVEFST